MRKILFLCRFNGIVYFVSCLLVSLPSRCAIFLNSNFLHIIPFINCASQFICNPRGVFIGDPFISKWGDDSKLVLLTLTIFLRSFAKTNSVKNGKYPVSNAQITHEAWETAP